MPDLIYKRHDTWPPLTATLNDQNGPINLQNAASVKLIMKGPTVLITGSCTVSNAINGIVTYTWATNDLSVSDTYNVEFEITWAGGAIQTVPNDGYRTLLVEDDLEGS